MAYTSALQKLAANLSATFENTLYSNPTNVGNSREKQVIEYLKRVMAKKYGFQSGEVFDLEDSNSGQIDIIIYDALNSVVFSDGTENVLAPIESTYGVISVKSKMGKKELSHAIEGIKKYESLVRTKPISNSVYIDPDTPLVGTDQLTYNAPKQQNINCIFAFDTTVATETILAILRDENCVDLLVVPNKICVVGRDRDALNFTKKTGERVGLIAHEGINSVSLFILILQALLKNNRLVAREIGPLIDFLVKTGNNKTY